MKKAIFIVLLCFTVAFAAFAIDMSPHPGDTLESVLTVQDDVVIMSQAAPAPADNMLYLEQFNYNSDEICLSANEEITGINTYSGLEPDMAVSYVGYEAGTIYNITGEVIAIYKTEFG